MECGHGSRSEFENVNAHKPLIARMGMSGFCLDPCGFDAMCAAANGGASAMPRSDQVLLFEAMPLTVCCGEPS